MKSENSTSLDEPTPWQVWQRKDDNHIRVCVIMVVLHGAERLVIYSRLKGHQDPLCMEIGRFMRGRERAPKNNVKKVDDKAEELK